MQRLLQLGRAFPAVNEVYGRHFEVPFPARIFIAVPDWPGEFDIEIDCIAACTRHPAS